MITRACVQFWHNYEYFTFEQCLEDIGEGALHACISNFNVKFKTKLYVFADIIKLTVQLELQLITRTYKLNKFNRTGH